MTFGLHNASSLDLVDSLDLNYAWASTILLFLLL